MDQWDGAGLGRIGNLPQPLSLEQMTEKVCNTLGKRHVYPVGAWNNTVQRVAVVGGSGGRLVSLARDKGAELFLTGDVGHHTALEASMVGMTLMDGGHFGTEKKAFEGFALRLLDVMLSRGWEIQVEIFEEETDPLKALV